jgi:hypothetical protein
LLALPGTALAKYDMNGGGGTEATIDPDGFAGPIPRPAGVSAHPGDCVFVSILPPMTIRILLRTDRPGAEELVELVETDVVPSGGIPRCVDFPPRPCGQGQHGPVGSSHLS